MRYSVLLYDCAKQYSSTPKHKERQTHRRTITQTHRRTIAQENNRTRRQSHKRIILQEHNYTDVESSTSQNGGANHQKIQANFEAGGGCQIDELVTQALVLNWKMGKKCFCDTTDFL